MGDDDRGLDPEWYTGPPWKAACIDGLWVVTSDRGDASDEYDVLESTSRAQAYLMAASPEMRHVLSRILDYPGIREHIGTIMHDAGLAAIAKAIPPVDPAPPAA